MFRRTIPAIVALAALALPAPTLAASAPQSIVLRQSDVPANYHVMMSFKVTAPQLSLRRLLPGAYTKHGRLGGYMAEFAPRRSTPVVASLVARYKSPSGAHWEVQNVRTYMASHHVAAPTVGGESFAFGYQSGKKKTLLAVFGIVFRRGAWAVEVTEAGKPGVVTVSNVVKYARIVDGRAQHG